VLASVRAARGDGLKLGLVAMVSVSIVHRLGASKLVKDAAAAGFDGFIFPDVPLEESEPLLKATREAGLTASLLVAPTTPPARMEKIARACSGFIYLLARVGITGDKLAGGGEADPGIDVAGIRSRIALLRGMTELPVACGFGISSADHVRAVVRPESAGGAGADAAIVGSALVKRMSKAAANGGDPVEEAESFTRALAVGLSG
jgi:tryptophan synthase alpha chain